MMAQDRHTSLTAQPALHEALAALLEQAQQNPALANSLRDLAHALLQALPAASDTAVHGDAYTDTPAHHDMPLHDNAHASEAASPHDIARLLEDFNPYSSPEITPEPIEDYAPELLISRLRLKAQACRWLEQHGYTSDPEALEQRNRLRYEAEQHVCYLWMFDAKIVNPLASRLLNALAANFDGVAELLELWENCRGHDEEREAAKLLARAQSALRFAVSQILGQDNSVQLWFDPDQQRVHQELRYYAQRAGQYLEYMTLDNPADPQQHAQYRSQGQMLEHDWQQRQQSQQQRTQRFNMLKYHAGKLAKGSHNPEHDWKKLLFALEALCEDNQIFENDRDLRKVLQPLAAQQQQAPEHPLLCRVFDALQQHDLHKQRQDALDDANNDDFSAADVRSAEVQHVAELLAGRNIVILGGQPKQDAIDAIAEHLHCGVDWIETKPHKSIYSFKANVIREEVLLVILLIRWSSHAYADVDNFCKEHAKLLVRITGGYNVNSLAHSILQQVGDQLEQRQP